MSVSVALYCTSNVHSAVGGLMTSPGCVATGGLLARAWKWKKTVVLGLLGLSGRMLMGAISGSTLPVTVMLSDCDCARAACVHSSSENASKTAQRPRTFLIAGFLPQSRNGGINAPPNGNLRTCGWEKEFTAVSAFLLKHLYLYTS